MNYRRTGTILVIGLAATLISGTAGFYWASSPHTETRITRKPNPKTETVSSDPTVETVVDTQALSERNWKAYLKYEGSRQRMLGVKKRFDEVNFRNGPGMEHSIIATPDGGALLKILDRVRNWYRARLRDGTIGWIHRSVIRILKVPTPVFKSFNEKLPSLKKTTKKMTPEAFRDNTRVSVTVGKANLRQGAGKQFAVAGRLYRYQEVRLLGKRGHWYRVVTPTHSTAWVRADLAKPVWETPPSRQKTITVTTRDLRMGPEHQFRRAIKSNTTYRATLLERQPPWFLVKLNDQQIGWVHRKEIRSLSGSSGNQQ